MVNVSCEPFHGWLNCYYLRNDSVRLIVTSDIGPRILSFGFLDGPNELVILDEDTTRAGEDTFRFYGGHRLWLAPESRSHTYAPDNQPVEVEALTNGLRLTAPVEHTTHIQKQLEITLATDAARVHLVHRISNRGDQSITLAPWALTMCAPEGVGIIPLPPEGDHQANLLPKTSLTLWAYTRMADPRWLWGDHYVLLRQNQCLSTPQKVGAYVEQGWIAYANHNHLFVKRFEVSPNGLYPDRGSNAELFANDQFLEIERFHGLSFLEPGKCFTSRNRLP